MKMLKFFAYRRAQSFLEYTVMILVISGALMAMNTYIRRSLNARLVQVQEELEETRR